MMKLSLRSLLLLSFSLLPCLASATESASLAQSKEVFASRCVSCHGADGAGSAAGKALNTIDLRSPVVKKATDAQLTEIISNGKGNMPPWQGTLTPEEINGLVHYVRSLGHANAATASKP